MIARLLGGKPEFAADALVDVFGEGFGHLDRQPVQIKVILVPVVGEPLPSRLRLSANHSRAASEARRPIVTSWSPMTSRSGSSTSRKKSATQSPPSLFWRGKEKRAISRSLPPLAVSSNRITSLPSAAQRQYP